MNDDFIYRSIPEPRREFVDSLYAKISKRDRRTIRLQSLLENIRSRPKLAFALFAVILILAACARQVAELAWERRGDFWVLETEPICQMVFYGDVDGPEPDPIPVREALARLDYTVELPTWAPPGFKMVDEISRPPSQPYDMVTIGWKNESEDWIWFRTSFTDWDPEVKAPPGAIEVFEIGEHPAVLVEGRCGFPELEDLMELEPGSTFQTEWDDTATRLTWKRDGVIYTLEAYGSYASADDLIRMAESAR